mgnify:CR=1 FL=1
MRNLISVLFILVSFKGFGQDTTQVKSDEKISIKGTVSVTNNGFSFIPAFTLDAPAAMANVTLSKKRLSFSLQARFAIDGRPWATAYITRYKLISDEKNDLSIGMQFPATAFIKRKIIENGVESTIIEAQQGLSPDINYGRVISSKLMLGVSYLRYEAIGNIFPKHGNYTSIWANIGNMKLNLKTTLSLNQQLFYLTIDELEGWYTAGNLSLTKEKCPISLSSMFFKTIKSNIGGKDFNWNVSMNYHF